MPAVEPVVLEAAPDHDLLAIHAVSAAVEREAGVPPVLITPPEQGLLDLRHAPAFVKRRSFVIREGERVIGAAQCWWEDTPTNRDHVQIEVEVLPSRQGRGHGRQLMTACLETAGDEFDARILDIEARRDDPSARTFLQQLGFQARLTSPRNVAWTKDYDRGLLQAWVDRAPERAADYELLTWDGPVPEEHRDEFVRLWHVMNTAPKEELDREDDAMTVEHSRAWDAGWVARGITAWTVVARHVPTGEFAGFTVLALQDAWPTVAEQEDTGVRPEHRNRGLGRWLKAANALRLLTERTDIEAIATWNAGSNEPMLAINHAMGFAPLEWWAVWQGEAKRVRELLTSSSR